MPGQSRDSPGIIPGQSRENFVYVFCCLLVFFLALSILRTPFCATPWRSAKSPFILQKGKGSLQNHFCKRPAEMLSRLRWWWWWWQQSHQKTRERLTGGAEGMAMKFHGDVRGEVRVNFLTPFASKSHIFICGTLKLPRIVRANVGLKFGLLPFQVCIGP